MDYLRLLNVVQLLPQASSSAVQTSALFLRTLSIKIPPVSERQITLPLKST